MHAESVQRSGATNPIVVGDRLDTDVEGARRADCASLLVLTGVTRPIDLIGARPEHRPDYLGTDVAALLAARPSIELSGASARCGNVTATIDGDVVRVGIDDSGPASTDGLDVVRAVASASWSVLDSSGRTASVQPIDDRAAAELGRVGIDRAPAR